ncbi:tRNA (adenosine(37)-N6)-dimethylallyltransferase MiaA [Ascidiaceihabitans sp.]|uniref:tRNA (adenosine(37)-N6)-dimethylallyltransferase MiaA n=1 Tax=Ascidiaceihabitans sp. TaxID=1872644 RepID=UPI00329A3BC7
MTIAGKFSLNDLPPEQPVLIAGPTASGKSALALAIAETGGGVVVNADASQVYDCWRVITACPSPAEVDQAPHALYQYVPYDAPYSVGHWLRDVAPYLGAAVRPIIVGGTGLNFKALTQGLANIPQTPPEIRREADDLALDVLLAQIDDATKAKLDQHNRMRVQRAWEVQRSTGRSLSEWHKATPPPLLDETKAACIVMDAQKDWLNDRIARRFDMMVDDGALTEIAAMQDRFDPALPACRAIGVPELMAHHQGEITLKEAKARAIISTRQYAKRQRTWFRSKMRNWIHVDPSTLS